MKIAFLVTAYTDFKHLVKLINGVAHPNATFFVHIDGKVKVDISAVNSRFYDIANVYFVEPRANISWGGFELMNTVLKLIRTAHAADVFDYYYLISGQDFAIEPISGMFDFLEANKGAEFLEHFQLPASNWGGNGGLDRFKYYWLIDELGMDKSIAFVEAQKLEHIERRFPLGLTPYGGSLWFTLTNSCISYLLRYLETNPSLVDFFKYTALADEILIPTLVMNSPFGKNVVNNNLRYIDWKSGPEYPRVLTNSDLGEILRSGCHFARKFSAGKDSKIIHKLADRINNR